ncbi:hypothetical protein JHD50_11980 [Sulfurimonas sp. MAG313]|nr:hypothetical protein [Sulfurimonas sp. MAG313]MDF1882008.1 hypothetical protein [Sulfurimonas sp. MAG313]
MKQLFLLFLLSLFLHANSYPKLFSSLGTPLYKADAVFEKFVDFPQVRSKAEAYHVHVYDLLVLANKVEKAKKPNKADKQAYISGLRILQKEHNEIIRAINAYLMKSIEADDYHEFIRIVTTGGSPLLENKIILNRSMAYYVKFRTRGKINLLEIYFETLESDEALMAYVQDQMPKVHWVKDSFKLPGSTQSLVLSKNEKYAYVANTSHCFKTLSIKNFSQISKLASFDFLGDGCNLVDVKISASGQYLFLSDTKNGFTILDVSQAKFPLQKDEYTKIHPITSVTTQDAVTSFIVRKNKGLLILDIYNKDEFRFLSNYNKGLEIKDLVLDENRSRLYLAHTFGISVLDISTLANPREVYSLPITNGATSIVLSPDKTLAYIASGEDGVHVLRLSNTNKITRVSTCLTPKFASSLSLSKDGKKLFVSALEDGVYLLDTQDVKELKHIGTYKSKNKDSRATTTSLNTNEDTLYISFSKAGIAKVKL